MRPGQLRTPTALPAGSTQGPRPLLCRFKASLQTPNSDPPQVASPSRRRGAAGPSSSRCAGRTHACRAGAGAEPGSAARGRPPPGSSRGSATRGARRAEQTREPESAAAVPAPRGGARTRGRAPDVRSVPAPLRRVFQTRPRGEPPALAGSEGAPGSLIKGPSTDLKPRRAVTPDRQRAAPAPAETPRSGTPGHPPHGRALCAPRSTRPL